MKLTKSVRFHEKSWISRNWLRQELKFCKLQEAIWLTVINKIFKLPPHFAPFCHVNYLYELSSGHPKYPTQKWYIWASLQRFRKRFRKLQEAMWLTIINEISKFPPRVCPFCQITICLSPLRVTRVVQFKNDTFGLASRPFQRFCKLQEAIWLTVIEKIFKFPPHFNPFGQVNYIYELSPDYSNHPTQKWNIWASFQSSRKRFRKLQEAI